MRNSLRRVREQKGLTLREAGEGMGIAFQTLAIYEKQDAPLKQSVVESAAEFYDVSQEEILTEPPELREDSTPYRLTTIPVDLLPGYILETIAGELTKQLGKAKFAEAEKILEAIRTVKRELHSRPDAPPNLPEASPEDKKVIELTEDAVDREIRERESKPPASIP